MNWKLAKFILGIVMIFIALWLLFAANSEGGQFLPSRQMTFQGAELAAVVLQTPCNMEENIEDGKKLLESSDPLQIIENSKKTKLRNGKYRTTYNLVRKEIAVAILDTKTCDIFEKRYWLNEDDIDKANALRKNYQENPGNMPNFMPVDPTNEYSVNVNWWNSHNSDLSIVKDGDRDRYIVVANKFAISNENLAYPDDRTGTRYSDIVYVPYSAGIHTTELVEKGKKFLDERVARAFSELEDADVESVSYPGKPVTETMNRIFPKNLFMTEQTDPALIFASDDNGKRLVERVLVRLGANGDKTFRYTYSKTGALGLGQIMPGTYASIAKRYPEAKLIKDVDIGRVDVVNGIKATILVLDDHFATVVSNANATSKGRTILAGKTSEQIEEIKAASYNGGPGKYKTLTGTISLAVRETVDFVRKFKMIRDLKFF